jgi:hypothetical protein
VVTCPEAAEPKHRARFVYIVDRTPLKNEEDASVSYGEVFFLRERERERRVVCSSYYLQTWNTHRTIS